jgi:glutamate formiminotransferase
MRATGALAINVYISEARSAKLLSRLLASAGRACVHVFSDPTYNRTGYTLASHLSDGQAAESSALELSLEALRQIDLKAHDGSHPRLGTLDHISVHALGDLHAAIATKTARRLGSALAAQPKGVPVYFYGDATSEGCRPLADLRRALGYFGGCSTEPPAPDCAPATYADADSTSGVVCIGSGPWVTNYNLALTWAASAGDDTTLLALGKRVAAVVSARRGGPLGCQSLALSHIPGVIEVACNLLHGAPPKETVRELVACAAAPLGLRIVRDYTTGLTPEEILEKAAWG